MSDDRGTGRTTRQLQAAPSGSLYVCPNHPSTRYIKRMAERLGRGDLRFASPQELETHKFRGLEFPAIILDHDTRMTERQRCELMALEAWVGRKALA